MIWLTSDALRIVEQAEKQLHETLATKFKSLDYLLDSIKEREHYVLYFKARPWFSQVNDENSPAWWAYLAGDQSQAPEYFSQLWTPEEARCSHSGDSTAVIMYISTIRTLSEDRTQVLVKTEIEATANLGPCANCDITEWLEELVQLYELSEIAQPTISMSEELVVVPAPPLELYGLCLDLSNLPEDVWTARMSKVVTRRELQDEILPWFSACSSDPSQLFTTPFPWLQASHEDMSDEERRGFNPLCQALMEWDKLKFILELNSKSLLRVADLLKEPNEKSLILRHVEQLKPKFVDIWNSYHNKVIKL